MLLGYSIFHAIFRRIFLRDMFLTTLTAVWSNSRLKKRTSWGKTSSSKLLHINCNDFFTINFFLANRKKLKLALCLEWLFEKPHFFVEMNSMLSTIQNFTHCLKINSIRNCPGIGTTLLESLLKTPFGGVWSRTDITTRLGWLQHWF